MLRNKFNYIEHHGEISKLYFSNFPTHYTLIDRCDSDVVMGHTWRLLKNGYVATEYKKILIYLHRWLMLPVDDLVVDHINRDRLDNRRANLRVCTVSQNQANRRADRRVAGTTSKYKGVSWNEERSRWYSSIHYEGKTHPLGRYHSEDEAALAYNKAAVARWGEHALLNPVERINA